jgi:hypothetical protein
MAREIQKQCGFAAEVPSDSLFSSLAVMISTINLMLMGERLRIQNRTAQFVLQTVLSLSVLSIFSIQPSASQVVTASLFGTVTDKSGAAVPGAKITVTNVATNAVSEATANSSGDFHLSGLPPGVYSVKCSYTGFKTWAATNITVGVETAQRPDPVLDIGGSSETVEVSSDGSHPPPVQPKIPFDRPIWNVWTEDLETGIPQFLPSPVVSGKQSLLVVDLAAIAFQVDQELGTYSRQISGGLDTWLKNNKNKKGTITVLIVPDQRYFERQDINERVKPLVVDISKISHVQKSGFKLKRSPFVYLQKHHGVSRFRKFGQRDEWKGCSRASH